jgi:hypothetical protein
MFYNIAHTGDVISTWYIYFHTNLKKASEWINCRRNKFLSLIIIKFQFFFSRIFEWDDDDDDDEVRFVQEQHFLVAY